MALQINKITIYRFIRFGLVGVFNTVLDLLVLNLLISGFGVVNPSTFFICKVVSFTVALVNSYFMNKYFTFSKRQRSEKEFYTFILVSLIGLIVNATSSSLAFYIFGLYPFIVSVHIIATLSGITGAIFSMVTNYVGYSYFVFKND